MRVESIGGNKYILVVIDVFTRYPMISLLKTKGEATKTLIELIKRLQTQREKTLKRLHSDGGKEFVNSELSKFLREQGTDHSTTTTHTPQHNGIVERANRTIMEMIRSMLFHSNAYLKLWGEAANVTAHLLSRSLTSASKTKSPMELWEEKPSIRHLRVFGCDAYYHIHKNERKGKMSGQAKPAIFVGYCDNPLYYRVYDVNDHNIVISRDVRFDDSSFKHMKQLKTTMKNEVVRTNTHTQRINDDDALPDNLTDELLTQLFPTDNDESHQDEHQTSSAAAQTSNSVTQSLSPTQNDNTHREDENELDDGNDNQSDSDVSLRGGDDGDEERKKKKRAGKKEERVNTKKKEKRMSKRRKSEVSDEKEENDDGENEEKIELPRRKRGRPRKVDVATVAVEDEDERDGNVNENDDPTTYEQAINSEEKDEWLKAINDELSAHKKNNTWSVVEKDASMNIIDTKWVFVKKRNENGVVKRYKARMVARGFHQQYGIDYTETFAPVIKTKSLRLIIALSSTTNEKRKLAQLDVKTAFLNARVREDIYVSAPKGMNIGKNKVLKLNKALYGIKQAPHEWNVEIDTYILSLGFRKCVKDTCVYVKVSKSGRIIILGLFVDDMIISYNETDEREWFEMKKRLMGKYELSDEGEAKMIVGMRLTKKNGYIYVDQRAYIREKLDEFRLSECRESPTPGTKVVLSFMLFTLVQTSLMQSTLFADT